MIDYKSAIDAAAWALLEGNGDFNSTFPVKLKDDPKALMQRNIQISLNDFPQIGIKVGGGAPVLRNPPRTFAMNDLDYSYSDVDVPVPCTVILTCEMKFDAGVYAKARIFAAEALVRSLWLSKHPKFGLSYVADFSIAEARKSQQMAGEGAVRTIEIRTQTITFNLRPMLSELAA